MKNEINISIVSGQDGGLVVYENVDDKSVVAFAGDAEATSKYLYGRMGAIIVDAKKETSRKAPAEPVPPPSYTHRGDLIMPNPKRAEA